MICPICKNHPVLTDAEKQTYCCYGNDQNCGLEHILMGGILLTFEDTDLGVVCRYSIDGRLLEDRELDEARQRLEYAQRFEEAMDFTRRSESLKFPVIPEPLKFPVGRLAHTEIKHPHETGCNMVFDPTDPVGSAKRMIEASRYSSQFRDSPVIRCLEALISDRIPTSGHPVDILEQIGRRMFPGHEIDHEAFGRLRAICDEPASVSSLPVEKTCETCRFFGSSGTTACRACRGEIWQPKVSHD